MENTMNKKGGILIWMIFLSMLIVAYEVSQNANFNVEKFKENLNWTHKDFELKEAPDLGKALSSFVNGFGEGMFSLMKWSAQFAKDNPRIPYKLLIYGLLISILAPIIYYGFLILIVIFLLIKEWYLTRKERMRYKT
jgi:hypothetical protein